MRAAFRILAADARHYWFLIGGWWAMMAGFCWLDATTPSRPIGNIFSAVAVMAMPAMILLVIHEHELTGDRQWFVTRPIPWGALLAAKLLFILLIGNTAVMVSQIVALWAIGESPAQHIGLLAARQVFLISTGVLPVAAVAAVTKNGMQAIAVALGAYAALYFVVLQASWLMPGEAAGDGSTVWVGATLSAAVAAAVSMAVLLLQYARRQTKAARILLGGGLLCAFYAPRALPWGMARSVAVQFSPHVDASVGEMAFEPARDPNIQANGPGRQQSGGVGPGPADRGEELVPVRLPVTIRGVPEGATVESERGRLEIVAQDGTRWNSGWTSGNFIHAREAGNSGTDGNGVPAWQYLVVERSFFEGYKKEPVHVSVRVAFTLYGPAVRTPLAPGRVQAVPGGICSVYVEYGRLQGNCSMLFSQVGYSLFGVDSPGLPNRNGRSGERRSYPGPYSTKWSFSIWDATHSGFAQPVPNSDSRAYFESRPALGYVDRDLDLPAVRLEEFR